MRVTTILQLLGAIFAGISAYALLATSHEFAAKLLIGLIAAIAVVSLIVGWRRLTKARRLLEEASRM